ncbi:MAG: hypothetical protein K0R55_4650 [Sporomusa sp.]|jgi:hypothetical protein|nr:hypothetical protein [Sporomusa sp.]
MMAINTLSTTKSVEEWINNYKGGCPEYHCLEIVGECNDYQTCESCLREALTREIAEGERRE